MFCFNGACIKKQREHVMSLDYHRHFLLERRKGVWKISFCGYTRSKVSFELQRLKNRGVKSKNLLTFTAPSDSDDLVGRLLIGLNDEFGP